MADIVLSNELYIVYDGTQIDCTTDFSLNVDKEIIDVRCGGGWGANLSGSKSWSLEFSAIVKRTGTLIFNDLLFQLIVSDVPVLVALKSNVLGDKYYQGTAFLNNLTETGTIDDVVKYSGTLQGYGPLNILTGDNAGFPYTFPYQLS